MRIWSKDLIPVLPNKQLKAMRYELGDMIKQYPNIKHGLVKYANNSHPMFLAHRFHDVLLEFDKRNIKHPLVKFANNYSCNYLLNYFCLICMECAERQISMNQKYNIEIQDMAIEKSWEKNPSIAVYNVARFNEDNDRYLKQCLYNLQEKYDRSIITEEEWEKVLEGVINNERI